MLHDDMTLSRFMVYAQSIEESKVGKISRNLKRSVCSDQSQPRLKKKVSTQEEPSSAKVKFEKECDSQNGKLACATCGKRHYGEFLLGTRSFFLMW